MQVGHLYLRLRQNFLFIFILFLSSIGQGSGFKSKNGNTNFMQGYALKIRIGRVRGNKCCYFFWPNKTLFSCLLPLKRPNKNKYQHCTFIKFNMDICVILVRVSNNVVVLNVTFNYISVISWRSVLLMEKTGLPRDKHRPVISYLQTLAHNVVSSTV